jgi:hypothetical protein
VTASCASKGAIGSPILPHVGTRHGVPISARKGWGERARTLETTMAVDLIESAAISLINCALLSYIARQLP